MGLMDEAKGLLDQNKDKVADGVDKATDVADDKTDGKYTEHLDKVDAAAEQFAAESGDDEK